MDGTDLKIDTPLAQHCSADVLEVRAGLGRLSHRHGGRETLVGYAASNIMETMEVYYKCSDPERRPWLVTRLDKETKRLEMLLQ